jgi:dienelactone hydrolase
MPTSSLRLALAALALLTLDSPLRAEIQTLYRGECYTFPEAVEKLQRFAATYNNADEWKARADNFRKGVRHGLKLDRLPPACPLNPIRHTVHEGDGYVVENVAFESLPGFYVTGNLYSPAKLDGKTAGILCPHGHGPDARMAAYTQTRCAALARMGAVVLAYDMVGIGESAPVPHKHSESMRLQTFNSMRAVDYLLSLGTIDDARLAVTGESGGGTQTFILSALDDRIDVSVPVVQVSAHFYGGCACESGMPIHKSDKHETDNVEIAASFAPKPQLVVSDGADWTQNVPKVEYPYIQHVYDLYGAKDQVENAHFADEKHDYGPSKRAAMYKFLAKHLKLDLARVQNPAGEIDENFFKKLDRADLLVFDAAHPRPDTAVASAEAVILLLDKK